MRCALAIDSKPSGSRVLRLLLVGVLWFPVACSMSEEDPPEETVLATRSGETGIQVTESTVSGQRIIRITTSFRGEESTVVMHIDEPVYEIDIPLSIQQQRPAGGGVGGGGAGVAQGGVGSLLAAQYLEKGQKAMLDGDYNDALRQVNLVLAVQPDHIQGLMMKGSVYYAMGNYQLANEQWEQVLTVDPSNQEVREFQDFLQTQQPSDAPNLPGTAPEGAPEPPGASQGGPSQPEGQQ